MGLFGKKKEKKSPEELKKEREEKIANTSKSLRLQIIALDKKKDVAFNKLCEAKSKGLGEQEKQARGLLKQVMAASKRANGMLMTLELAIETRDLAELNLNFLDSISALSDDIISSGKQTNESRTKKAEDKYLKAMFVANQQKENIDNMLSVGDYASVTASDTDSFTEFDTEIDEMLQSATLRGEIPAQRNKI